MQGINTSPQGGVKPRRPQQKARKSPEVRGAAEALDRRHVSDVLASLKSSLNRANLWDSLDYFEISSLMRKTPDALFPRYEWLSCAPVTSCGSHYVYIGAVYNGKHRLVFVGKTSKGFDRACEIANICARELGA